MRISDCSSDVCSSDLGEFVKQVTVIERHGSDERHWDSQGAGVCMVLRSCSFASAGRSSIARNSLYISGDTEMTRWSRMAFSVAFLDRSEEHTSELQSLMRISYAAFCLKKKKSKS